jgi:hypothetical protein
VRVDRTSAHLRRNPDSFHELLLGGARLRCRLRMAANAIRKLGRVRHRHRDQLLGLAGQGAVGKHAVAEDLEGIQRLGREFRALTRDLGTCMG